MTEGGRALALLISLATLGRAVLALALGPGNDEAYHALFAIHLDWGYFDHPPAMALVAAIGTIPRSVPLAIAPMRLGFILLGAASTWLMARLTARFFGDRAGLIAAFLLNATAYYGIAAGTFILPDGPLLFFWILTLDRLAAAVDSPDRLGPWAGLGLAWGGAMLSKYHAVFLPMGATLFLLAEPRARRSLRRPGPYLAFAIGAALFMPVVAWNAEHGWVSFAFQASRASVGSRSRPYATLPAAILSQAAYLLPWIWLPLWGSLIRAARRLRQPGGSADRFFLSQTILPMATFMAISTRRSVLPHWSLVAMIPAFPLLGRDWCSLESGRLRRRLSIFGAATVAGLAVFIAQARWGLLQRGAPGRPGLLSPVIDPTADMYGWDAVARELRSRGLLNEPDTFLFTSKWYHSGHLAFATGGRVPVLCYNPRGAHNFAYWEDTRRWIGRDGILVVINESSTEPAMFNRWFERIEALGEFPVLRARGTIRRVRLFRCVKQLRPFPKNGSDESSVPDLIPASSTTHDRSLDLRSGAVDTPWIQIPRQPTGSKPNDRKPRARVTGTDAALPVLVSLPVALTPIEVTRSVVQPRFCRFSADGGSHRLHGEVFAVRLPFVADLHRQGSREA